MSWLSAVTGKAEDFLNKLDRSAADALMPEDTGSSKTPPPHPVTLHHQGHQAPQHSYTPASLPAAGASAHSHSTSTSRLGQSVTAPAPKRTLKSSAASGVSATTRTSGDGGSVSVKKQSSSGPPLASDEALFDFLNSKNPLEGNRKRGTPPPVSVSQQSRQGHSDSAHGDGGKMSSLASGQTQYTAPVSASTKAGWSMTDQTGAALTVTHTDAAESADTEPTEPGLRSSPTHSHESADPEALAEAMKESPPASLSSGGGELEPQFLNGQDCLSALELENGLLKNEVASLNQEITSLIQHAKKAQTELVRTKEQLTEHSSSATLKEQLVQEVQVRERDLHEALKAKDSQLAILRLQLEEADRKTASLTTQLTSLTTDRDRLVKAGDSGQSQAVDSLRHKLSDLESLLTRERQNHTQYQKEATERQSRMEQEERALADAVTAAEKRVTEEKAKAAEASSQCRTVRAMLESTKQEMAEYKEKASRILQSKDRLITSLRDGSEASGSLEGGGVSSLEYLSLQQERDMLRDELHKARAALETSHAELQEMEGQLHQEGEEAQDRIRSLENQLAEQQQQCTEIEQELHLQKQDLQYTLDDLQRQKGNFQSRLSDREAEIEKLRGQLTAKSLSSTSESELESRVRSLTESLIQKQTMLESLSTENNSLTLQLERLGQQYRDAEHTLMRSAVASNRSGVADDDSRQRLPTFMREGVTDTEVTRKVKHYVNTIDRFSVRLGVFLRRYPAARVFVLVYMLLLHLWVMVVLATHQEEIH